MYSDNHSDKFNSSRPSTAVQPRGRGFTGGSRRHQVENDDDFYNESSQDRRNFQENSFRNNNSSMNRSFRGESRRQDYHDRGQSSTHQRSGGYNSYNDGRQQMRALNERYHRENNDYQNQREDYRQRSFNDSRRNKRVDYDSHLTRDRRFDNAQDGNGYRTERELHNDRQGSFNNSRHHESGNYPTRGGRRYDNEQNENGYQRERHSDRQMPFNSRNNESVDYDNRDRRGGRRVDNEQDGGGYQRQRHDGNQYRRDSYPSRDTQAHEQNRPRAYNGHNSNDNGQNTRRFQRAPSGWHPEDRDIQKIMSEGVQGAQRLRADEDRVLEVLNINEPPKVDSWQDLHLHSLLLENIREMGFSNPRESQKKIIPLILAGHDVVAQCETGGGKTAAFAIPIIQNIIKMDITLLESSKMDSIPLALVLAPTRELATQLFEQIRALARNTGISVVLVHGEMNKAETQRRMKLNGCQILVGTCGRVSDHIEKRDVCVQSLKMLILDDADQMNQTDPNFSTPLERFLANPPFQSVLKKLQIVITSATLGTNTQDLSRAIIKPAVGQEHPVTVRLTDEKLNRRVALNFVRATGLKDRMDKFKQIVNSSNADMKAAKQMIFVNRKDQCDSVCRLLCESEIPAKILSSYLPQNERDQVIKDFRDGQFDVLVTTDVMSRGIDIHDLNRVIMMDLPTGSFEEASHTFTHRIGRIGRLTAGKAYVIVDVQNDHNKKQILPVIDVVENKNGMFVPEWLQEYAAEARKEHAVRQRDLERSSEVASSVASSSTLARRASSLDWVEEMNEPTPFPDWEAEAPSTSPEPAEKTAQAQHEAQETKADLTMTETELEELREAMGAIM